MANTNLGKVALTPKGEYDAAMQYERLDIVSYNGSSFIVLKAVVGITPSEGEYYMLVASRGAGHDTPEGGQIFNDYETNKALAPFSAAFGQDNVSGQKAFTVIAFDEGNKTFTLAESPTGLAVGDVFSAHLNLQETETSETKTQLFIDFGTITDIQENVITVDTVPKYEDYFDMSGYLTIAIKDSYLDNDNVDTGLNGFWVMAKPEVGVRRLGNGAIGAGYHNRALLNSSAVFGKNNRAYGSYNLAAGVNNETFQYGGIALGGDNKAKNKSSVAMGSQNTVEATKLIGGSALGIGNKVSNGRGVAIGIKNTVSHDATTAMGVGLISRSEKQLLLGKYNNPSTNPIVIGGGNSDNSRKNLIEINNEGQVLSGNSGIVDDMCALTTKNYVDTKVGEVEKIFDIPLEVGGYLAILQTSATGASGRFSVALNDRSIARGRGSLVSGVINEGNSRGTFVSGVGNIANGYAQTVVGEFNVPIGSGTAEQPTDAPTDADIAKFIVGNGTSQNYRSNAFVVYKDGHAEVKTMGTTDNSVVTKAYFDSVIAELKSKLAEGVV